MNMIIEVFIALMKNNCKQILHCTENQSHQIGCYHGWFLCPTKLYKSKLKLYHDYVLLEKALKLIAFRLKYRKNRGDPLRHVKYI